MAWVESALYVALRPWAQPLIGTIHGWFATKMVVIMLFRPYNAYYWPGSRKKMPFTPGIFPRRQRALAENIANTVTRTLLTPESIEARSRHLATEDNLYRFVKATSVTFLEGFRYTDRLQRLAGRLKEVVPPLLEEANAATLRALAEDRHGRLTKVVDTLFDEILLPLRIDEDQARMLVGRGFDLFFSPEQVRLILIEALAEENNERIEAQIQARTRGLVRFIAGVVGIANVLNRIRLMLMEDPEEGRQFIAEVTESLSLRETATQKLVGFSLSHLPLETVDRLRQGARTAIQEALIKHHDTIQETLQSIEGELLDGAITALLRFNPDRINPQALDGIQREIAGFLYVYLSGELEGMIKRGLNALDMPGLIIEKIEGYSPKQVEDLIHGIMQRELRSLEYLGAFIGFLLGIMAFFVERYLPLPH